MTARYAPYVGGIETHVREVSTRMVTLGHQVTVLTTDPLGPPDPDNLADIIDGVWVKRVPAWPKNRDFYFVIVGSGPYGPELRALVNSFGLENRVVPDCQHCCCHRARISETRNFLSRSTGSSCGIVA